MNTEQLPHTIKAPRIEYIDLAKGICILLVVLFHLKEMYKVHSCLDVYLYSTLIPLYFFLSGYVFKTYGGWNEFILKKIKRLIIPFAFFYITTSVLIPITA
ncbi:MAG: acyltransferase family protein, partial [Sodaliphilus sp.]|nr:acyltransferase family protein [Sodaliphilus sp.]